MKSSLILASLLAALPAQFVMAVPETIPGKVGTVTISLTLTTERDGFEGTDTRVITDTATAFKQEVKTLLVKQKYSNVEFLQDMIERYDLSGVPADWSIKYVEAYDGCLKEFFLLKKTGEIVPIGSAASSSFYEEEIGNSSLIRVDDLMGGEFPSFYGYTETTTHVRKNGNPVSGNTYTSYAREGYTYFILSPAYDVGLLLIARASEGGSEKTTYVFEGEYPYDTSYTYTKGASSYTEILGFDSFMGGEDASVLTSGSIKITALVNTANVSNYVYSLRRPD